MVRRVILVMGEEATDWGYRGCGVEHGQGMLAFIGVM
jgi:hypothetical protein